MAAGVLPSQVFELFASNLQTVLVFSLAFLLACMYLRRPQNLPPYPAGCLPVLGHLLALGRAPHRKLTAWRRHYGDVFTVRTGMEDVVVLNGYAAVKDAVVSRSELFASRPAIYMFDAVFGSGKDITSARWGTEFKQRKRFGLTVLKNLGMKVGTGSIEEKIRGEASCLRNRIHLGGKTTTARQHPLAREVLPATEVNRACTEVLKQNSKIQGVLLDEIASHRENLDRENPRDFLDACLLELELQEKVAGLTEENVMYMTQNLFFGGTETTTNTLLWSLLYMTLNPDIQNKVQQQLDAVVGEGLPALSHRSQLPYVNACLLEVMRIRPIGPLSIPRATTQTVKVQGYDIPVGIQVLLNLHSLHMDPAYWPDPDRFDPGRFLDAEGNVINKPESFMPFGGGRRVCIGEQLARMELFLFFSTLLQSFTFRTPEGATTPSTDGVFHITLRPHPFKLCAIPRY